MDRGRFGIHEDYQINMILPCCLWFLKDIFCSWGVRHINVSIITESFYSLSIGILFQKVLEALRTRSCNNMNPCFQIPIHGPNLIQNTEGEQPWHWQTARGRTVDVLILYNIITPPKDPVYVKVHGHNVGPSQSPLIHGVDSINQSMTLWLISSVQCKSFFLDLVLHLKNYN